MKRSQPFLVALFLALVTSHAQPPPGRTARLDVTYVTRERGGDQKLDLYLPSGKGPFPLVLRIHGGAWRAGSKRDGVPIFLVDAGFAVASVEYRFIPAYPFPAQIQDCKAALRFLREHAAGFDIDPGRVAVMGDSAGAHLAALMGLAPDAPALTDAPDSRTSERVRAVVDFYGPSDLEIVSKDFNAAAHPDLVGIIDELLGVPAKENLDAVRAASPVTYVDKTDPPFMILQGEADDIVPSVHSKTLDAALTKAGVPSELILIPGCGHGGGAFWSPEQCARIVAFLKGNLG